MNETGTCSQHTLGELTREESERVGAAAPVVLSCTKYDGLVPSADYFKGRTIHSADISHYKLVKRGWFAYATNHLAEGSIGLQDRFDTAGVSPIYTVFSCTDEVEPAYLFRLLKTDTLVNAYRIHEQATVDRRGAVRYREFAKISVRLPSLQVQRDSTHLLDTLDAAIAGTDALMTKLRALKQGVLEELLRHGLQAAGRGSDASGRTNGSSESDPIPTGWHMADLAAVIDGIDAGKSPDCLDRPAAIGEWGVLKVSAVNGNGFAARENKALPSPGMADVRYAVHQGDLLMTRANTYEHVGAACIVDEAPDQLLLCDKTLRLRTKASINRRFLLAALQSHAARRQIEVAATGTSGSMKNISQASILRLQIPVPPRAEQDEIVSTVDVISHRLATELAYARKLRLVRQGLVEDCLACRLVLPVTRDGNP